MAIALVLALAFNCLPIMQMNANAATATVASPPISLAPTSGNVVINFSAVMATSSGAVLLNGSPLSGGAWSNGDTTYSVPYGPLVGGSPHTITTSGFVDMVSAPSDLASPYTFTVLADTVSPTVIFVTPSNFTPAPTSGTLSITFSEPMDTSVGLVKIGSTPWGGGGWSAGNTVYSVTYSGLTPGQTYSIEIGGFKDVSGNFMTPNPQISYSMTVADNGAPSVVSVTPTGTNVARSGNVVITFSKAMSASTAGSVTLNGTALSGGTWNSGNTVFTVPYSNLALSTNYSIAIGGFRDASLNLMNAFTPVMFTTVATGDSSYSYTQTPAASNGYTAVSNVDFSKFKGVSLDGYTLVSGVDYVAKSGSTIVTLTGNIINKLTVGSHRIVLHFSDGTASGNFNVTTGGLGTGTAIPPATYPTNVQQQQTLPEVQSLVDQQVDDGTVEHVIKD